MKKNMVNILATTGISLLLLSVVALFFHARCIYLETVFQTFGVNAVAHIGIIWMKKTECKNLLIETISEIIWIVCILLTAGYLFQWFASLSLILLTCIGVATYILSLFLNLLQMKQEAKEINLLIKKRDNKQA